MFKATLATIEPSEVILSTPGWGAVVARLTAERQVGAGERHRRAAVSGAARAGCRLSGPAAESPLPPPTSRRRPVPEPIDGGPRPAAGRRARPGLQPRPTDQARSRGSAGRPSGPGTLLGSAEARRTCRCHTVATSSVGERQQYSEVNERPASSAVVLSPLSVQLPTRAVRCPRQRPSDQPAAAG